MKQTNKQKPQENIKLPPRKKVNDINHLKCCANNGKLFWEAMAPIAYGWQLAFSLCQPETRS